MTRRDTPKQIKISRPAQKETVEQPSTAEESWVKAPRPPPGVTDWIVGIFADVTSCSCSACSTLPAVDPNHERHVHPRKRPLLSAVGVVIYEMHAILINAQILVSGMARRARAPWLIFFSAPDTLASTATSSWSSSTRMAVCATPTTRTTEMTVSSAKRVSLVLWRVLGALADHMRLFLASVGWAPRREGAQTHRRVE